MTLLQVRNCPEDLYRTIARKAVEDRRSIAQETLVLLEEALAGRAGARRARRREALDRLVAEPDRPDRPGRMRLDPVALIREDRDR